MKNVSGAQAFAITLEKKGGSKDTHNGEYVRPSAISDFCKTQSKNIFLSYIL